MPKELKSRILEASMVTYFQLVFHLYCEAPHVSTIPREVIFKQTLAKFKYVGSLFVVFMPEGFTIVL